MKSTTNTTRTTKTKSRTGSPSAPRVKRTPVRRSVEAAIPVAWPMDEAIRARAYELFERRGRAHGLDLDDWFQAERELHAEQG